MTAKYEHTLTMSRVTVSAIFQSMGLPEKDVTIFWRRGQRLAAIWRHISTKSAATYEKAKKPAIKRARKAA